MSILVSSGSWIPSNEFSGIYGWQNHITGKWYVGQSIAVVDRLDDYPPYKGQKLIREEMSDFGIENFSCYRLMECCSSPVALNYWETFWVKEKNSIDPNGYNSTSGGGNYGKRSPATIERMRIAKSNVSDETRMKLSKALTGIKRGPHKPEHIKKVADMNRGKKRTLEQRNRIGLGGRGKKKRPRTEEEKKYLSLIQKQLWAQKVASLQPM